MIEEFQWARKYRPHNLKDVILPSRIKNTLEGFIKQDNIPNILLTGKAGIGKTTSAIVMLEMLDCDYIMINGSLNGNIDTLRNEILSFASSTSLKGKRKYVILDEADYLNQQSTQPALRNFTVEFSRTCGFILTCNYKKRIIPELHSRCQEIEFKIEKSEMPKIAMQFMKRVEYILDKENVKYEKPVVAEIIQRYFPDFRRTINELQGYAASGPIDSGILAVIKDKSISELMDFMKAKNYTGMLKWMKTNFDNDTGHFYLMLFERAYDYFKPSFIPNFIFLLEKYQFQAISCMNPEINVMAFLAECMVEAEFK